MTTPALYHVFMIDPCTRGVEAFLKKIAIAYHQNLTFLLGSRPYAIAVFFKNASTPRVPCYISAGCVALCAKPKGAAMDVP